MNKAPGLLIGAAKRKGEVCCASKVSQDNETHESLLFGTFEVDSVVTSAAIAASDQDKFPNSISEDNHICMNTERKLGRILFERESISLPCLSYYDVSATILSALGRASNRSYVI